MKIGTLEVVFLEKLLVRDFLEIQRLHEKLEKKEIDQIDLQIRLLELVILSINGEMSKEKIHETILEIDNLQDYQSLIEHSAKLIQNITSEVKKKK